MRLGLVLYRRVRVVLPLPSRFEVESLRGVADSYQLVVPFVEVRLNRPWDSPNGSCLTVKNPTIVEVHSSSAAGAIVPPAAAICSRNASRTRASVEVRGSISETELIIIERRFALWREPIIE